MSVIVAADGFHRARGWKVRGRRPPFEGVVSRVGKGGSVLFLRVGFVVYRFLGEVRHNGSRYECHDASGVLSNFYVANVSLQGGFFMESIFLSSFGYGRSSAELAIGLFSLGFNMLLSISIFLIVSDFTFMFMGSSLTVLAIFGCEDNGANVFCVLTGLWSIVTSYSRIIGYCNFADFCARLFGFGCIALNGLMLFAAYYGGYMRL